MASNLMDSIYDVLNSYVLRHGLNPNVILPLINDVVKEAQQGWEVTGVIVSTQASHPTTADEVQMVAVVTGTGEFSQDVTWSITGNKSLKTTISNTGLLTVHEDEFVPDAVTHGITVTATSVDNSKISGAYVVYCDNGIYSVTYHANGGAGTMIDANSPYDFGDEVTLLANEFEAPTGKVFSHWATALEDGVIVDDDFEIEMNVNLYAIWSAVYTVIYHANGGADAPVEDDSGPYLTGEEVTVLVNSFQMGYPDGKIFRAWNTQADGGGITYHPDDTFEMGTESVILYVEWMDIISKVSLAIDEAQTLTESSVIINYAQVIAGPGANDAINRNIIWSIDGHVGASYISNNGALYVAPDEFTGDATTHTIEVKAASEEDPSKYAIREVICQAGEIN